MPQPACGIFDFFDTLRYPQLLSQLVSMQYPPGPAVLGSQVHFAPRVFAADGVVARACVPQRSILAGCSQSVAFTRAYVRDELDSVVAATDACQAGYVDDFSRFVSGSFGDALEVVFEGGKALLGAAKRLHLTLSAKSLVVASSGKLAVVLQKRFASIGLTVKVAQEGRDLGLCFNASGRRSCTLVAHRLDKAAARHKKLMQLVSVHRVAGKLARSNPLAVASWGSSALGMAWSTVASLRRQLADASGARSVGWFRHVPCQSVPFRNKIIQNRIFRVSPCQCSTLSVRVSPCQLEIINVRVSPCQIL